MNKSIITLSLTLYLSSAFQPGAQAAFWRKALPFLKNRLTYVSAGVTTIAGVDAIVTRSESQPLPKAITFKGKLRYTKHHLFDEEHRKFLIDKAIPQAQQGFTITSKEEDEHIIHFNSEALTRKGSRSCPSIHLHVARAQNLIGKDRVYLTSYHGDEIEEGLVLSFDKLKHVNSHPRPGTEFYTTFTTTTADYDYAFFPKRSPDMIVAGIRAKLGLPPQEVDNS